MHCRETEGQWSKGLILGVLQGLVPQQTCFPQEKPAAFSPRYVAKPSQVMLVVKNLPANAGDIKRCGFDLRVQKIPWRRKWQLTPEFLPRESHGQRGLGGYSPWGGIELDMTEVTEHACVLCIKHFAQGNLVVNKAKSPELP